MHIGKENEKLVFVRVIAHPEFLNVKFFARADLSFIIFARKMSELGQTNMAMKEQKLQIQCFKEA